MFLALDKATESGSACHVLLIYRVSVTGVQMDQTRWAARGTALARPGTTSIVLGLAWHNRRAASAHSAGPARHDFGVGTTPARFFGMICEM